MAEIYTAFKVAKAIKLSQHGKGWSRNVSLQNVETGEYEDMCLFSNETDTINPGTVRVRRDVKRDGSPRLMAFVQNAPKVKPAIKFERF